MGRLARGAGLALVLAAVAFPASGSPAADWAERVQVVYDAEARRVERLSVRVVDPHPEKNLDFTWEPAAGNWPGIDAQGAATGEGRLIWRIRGSADYDPATIYSSYVGEMRDGRPNGRGRIDFRDGAWFEGMFADGALSGEGLHVDAAGNRYEGTFRDGRADGQGRFMDRNGSIYEGAFRHGLKHGNGQTRLTGGTVYRSQWSNGVEIGGKRPDVMADALVGGLLHAQAGGGAAGKVEMSIAIDQRMTGQQEMRYQHLVREQDVAIYPVDQSMNDAWNGGGRITEDFGTFNLNWENAFAFVEAGIATTDGSRVELDALSLEVAQSSAYRKPMLALQPHLGCVGFRPTFSVFNHGWGAVQNPTLNVRFTSPDRPGESSPTYSLAAPGFSEGADISLADALRAAGVDTAALETERFTCPSHEQMNVCRAQTLNRIQLGQVADFVHGDNVVRTTATGEIAYSYSDDGGNSYPVSETFEVELSLAVIEVQSGSLAECGDGGFPAAEALRYVDVELPVNQTNYGIDIPVRGNRNIRDYTARLKISSEMSSFHSFTAAARFADGSIRRSKPVSLFYFKPRWPSFSSQVALPQCYLDPDFGAGC